MDPRRNSESDGGSITGDCWRATGTVREVVSRPLKPDPAASGPSTRWTGYCATTSVEMNLDVKGTLDAGPMRRDRLPRVLATDVLTGKRTGSWVTGN